MSKHQIEIEGLPDGWEAVAYRYIKKGDFYFDGVTVEHANTDFDCPWLIVQKTKPRRIVLEETEEERSVSYGDWFETDEGLIKQWDREDVGSLGCFKIWRQVKEGE